MASNTLLNPPPLSHPTAPAIPSASPHPPAHAGTRRRHPRARPALRNWRRFSRAAADYSMATKWATFRLSELAVGIGPFVIGPVVERKIGLANFAKLSLTPAEWQTAEWAKNIGLYQESFETVEQLDNYLKVFIDNLLSYSPMALAELKKVFWQGTDHWDSLLIERANISCELILSDYAKSAIQSFKVKA